MDNKIYIDMNIHALDIKGRYKKKNRDYAKVIAFVDDKEVLKFHVNMSKVNIDKFEKFCAAIMEGSSRELKLGNGESISYEPEESAVAFDLRNCNIILTNTLAPECLPEALECLILDNDEDYVSDSNDEGDVSDSDSDSE